MTSLARHLESVRESGAEPRYALTFTRKVAHVLPSEERCNVDSVVDKRVLDHIPPGFRLCRWCARRIG